MVIQERTTSPTQPNKVGIFSLYFAALGGAIIAAIADLIMNDTAAAAVKLNEVMSKYLCCSLNFGVLLAIGLLGGMGCFLCWLHAPNQKVDAFNRGVSVFAVLSIIVPFRFPQEGISGKTAVGHRTWLFGISVAHAEGLGANGKAVVRLEVRSEPIKGDEAVSPLITIRDAKTMQILGRERITTEKFEVARPVGGYILEIDAPGLRRTKASIEIEAEPKVYEVPLKPSSIPLGIQRLYAPKEVQPQERPLFPSFREEITAAPEESASKTDVPENIN